MWVHACGGGAIPILPMSRDVLRHPSPRSLIWDPKRPAKVFRLSPAFARTKSEDAMLFVDNIGVARHSWLTLCSLSDSVVSRHSSTWNILLEKFSASPREKADVPLKILALNQWISLELWFDVCSQ